MSVSPPAAAATPTPDDVLRIADVHAEDSSEDGKRTFDRGGLMAFASDLARYTPAAATPIAPAEHGSVDLVERPVPPAAALGRVERDAARYRWLRANTGDQIPYRGWWGIAGGAGAVPERLDAAIDAAMKEQA